MTNIRHHDKKVRHNIKNHVVRQDIKSVSCRQNFHDIKTFVMTSISATYFKKLCYEVKKYVIASTNLL